jgi:pimeloyl-ACP methyl ester carboxylesterase
VVAGARWLADHGRVVGLDARGHGRSQARGPWTTERLAADVVPGTGHLVHPDAPDAYRALVEVWLRRPLR